MEPDLSLVQARIGELCCPISFDPHPKHAIAPGAASDDGDSALTTVLVMVSGAPGAGKTTLAKRLGSELCLPVLHRDDFKDTMFESLGWSDRAWSMKVGAASWELLYMVMEKFLSRGVSVVCDSNFERRHAADRLCEMQKRCPFEIVELHCFAEPKVLARRLRERGESGGRHPGHAHLGGLAEETAFLAAIAMRDFGPIGVGDHFVDVDTNDPERIDWDGIVTAVRGVLEGTMDQEDR